MRRIPFAELENRPDDILAYVEAGETVMITRDGRDTMQLVPIAQDRPGGHEVDLVG